MRRLWRALPPDERHRRRDRGTGSEVKKKANNLTDGTASPAIIDIRRLPETGFKNLVGRKRELTRLDAAWADPKVNIYSLVAEGGAGKSALIEAWLTKIQAENYCGAAAVFGWSFYNQSSKERSTSSEAFLDWALAQLGVIVQSTADAADKGREIAKALGRRRVLLVLDGLETLQQGPGPQVGALTDEGLQALLCSFAAEPPASNRGLIVVVSRVEVTQLRRWRETSARTRNLDALSDKAGAQLLCDNGAVGTKNALRAAARDFGCHALALTLLAHYLRETHGGDITCRDHIRGLLTDAKNRGHDHAIRVMESLQNEWLTGQPSLLRIMYIVGLFDRPASGKCLRALRADPAIPNLTDLFVDVNDVSWEQAIERLREVRLLAPVDKIDPESLNTHPLTREWFGSQLRAANEPTWKQAHSRLFEHLCDRTREGETPTINTLAPLYQAIGHGCCAGRFQEALVVYKERICRRWPTTGKLEYYPRKFLHATSADLAGLSWFFEKPYTTLAATFSSSADRSFVLRLVADNLLSLGRLNDAAPLLQAVVAALEAEGDFLIAATYASIQSETECVLGEIAAAVQSAERSVLLADLSGNALRSIINRSTLANAEASAGRTSAAKALFAEAEARQRQLAPGRPWLYSYTLEGYVFCDLLIGETAFCEAEKRIETREFSREFTPIAQALNSLTQGRSSHGSALAPATNVAVDERRRMATKAKEALDDAVKDLGGARDEFISLGLLARASFRRSCGDFTNAAQDLKDVGKIVEYSEMRLLLCDLALERARLALCRRSGFAPLATLIGASPPPQPETVEAARKSFAEARLELTSAAKLVDACGYHKRDEELAELQAIVCGKRELADLPPRV